LEFGVCVLLLLLCFRGLKEEGKVVLGGFGFNGGKGCWGFEKQGREMAGRRAFMGLIDV
jgi:hypothetical protein